MSDLNRLIRPRSILGISIFVASPILVLGLIATTAPAAQASLNDCFNTGAMTCLYNGSNYAGSPYKIINSGGIQGTCQLQNLGAYNNWAASVYNSTIYTQYMWTNQNFTGSQLTISPQSGFSSLSSTFNYNLESWRGFCSVVR